VEIGEIHKCDMSLKLQDEEGIVWFLEPLAPGKRRYVVDLPEVSAD
jgi:hypothetical protein